MKYLLILLTVTSLSYAKHCNVPYTTDTQEERFNYIIKVVSEHPGISSDELCEDIQKLVLVMYARWSSKRHRFAVGNSFYYQIQMLLIKIEN